MLWPSFWIHDQLGKERSLVLPPRGFTLVLPFRRVALKILPRILYFPSTSESWTIKSLEVFFWPKIIVPKTRKPTSYDLPHNVVSLRGEGMEGRSYCSGFCRDIDDDNL